MATQSIGRVSIILKGTYDPDITYSKLDIVRYQGSSYCAKKDTNGNLPTDTEFWQLIAEKGEKGEQGEKGATGDMGATGNGIADVQKTSSSGITDTYTITFTDGTTFDFDITNGSGNDWADIRNKPFSQFDSNFFKVVSNALTISDSFKSLVNQKMDEPTTEGSNGQALLTDGNGNRIWGDVLTDAQKSDIAKISTLESDIDAVQDLVSDEYSATKEYHEGDYFIYNNELWKVLGDAQNVAPVEGSLYKKVKVADEVTALNSKLTNDLKFKLIGSVVGGSNVTFDTTAYNELAIFCHYSNTINVSIHVPCPSQITTLDGSASETVRAGQYVSANNFTSCIVNVNKNFVAFIGLNTNGTDVTSSSTMYVYAR